MSGHGISTQAYICPVCFDDHSTGPHRFTDEELAARDARLRAEIAADIRAYQDANRGPGMDIFGQRLATTIAEGKP